MSDQTNKGSAWIAVLIAVFFYFGGAAMLYQGKAGRFGHVSTPKKNPAQYWIQVGGAFVGGTIAAGYGLHLIRGKNKTS